MEKPDIVIDITDMSMEERQEFSVKFLKERLGTDNFDHLTKDIRESVKLEPIMVCAALQALLNCGIGDFGGIAMIAHAFNTSPEEIIILSALGMLMLTGNDNPEGVVH